MTKKYEYFLRNQTGKTHGFCESWQNDGKVIMAAQAAIMSFGFSIGR